MRVFGLLITLVWAAIGLSGQSAAGDAGRGKAIVEGKGGCLNCHRIKDAGSTFGPDLSEIGTPRPPAQLEKSILEPDAEMLPAWRPYRIVTKSGETVTGRMVNIDTFTVQIYERSERYRSFQKSDLRDFGFADKSPMPSFKDRLSPPELADVVAYLSSLKAPPGAGRGGRGGGGAPAPGTPPLPPPPPAAEPH